MMNCSMCSCQLKTSSSEEGKIGVNYNDQLFCSECHEVMLFAGDLVAGELEDIPLKDIPLEDIPKEEKQMEVTTSGNMVKCSKCESEVSGSICKCGQPNPLLMRKPKKKKRKGRK